MSKTKKTTKFATVIGFVADDTSAETFKCFRAAHRETGGFLLVMTTAGKAGWANPAAGMRPGDKMVLKKGAPSSWRGGCEWVVTGHA